jgi:hypothetical protein
VYEGVQAAVAIAARWLSAEILSVVLITDIVQVKNEQ